MDGTFIIVKVGELEPHRVAINMSRVRAVAMYDKCIRIYTNDDEHTFPWEVYDNESINLILDYLKRNALGTNLLED